MEVKSYNIQAGSDLCDRFDSYNSVPGDPEKAASKKAGQIPFMGQQPVSDPSSPELGLRGKLWNQSRSYLEDANNHPIFLTNVRFAVTGSSGFKIFIEPFQIRFATKGNVQGCVWFGLASSIDAVDEGFYSALAPDQLAELQSTPREDRLSKYIALTKPSQPNFAFLETRSCIYSFAELEVVNCAFEAIGPAIRFSGNRNERAVIGCSTELVKLRGLWFIGQCKIEKTSDSDGMPFIRTNVNRYKFTGHHNALVSSELVDVEENGTSLLITLGGGALLTGPSADRDYNLRGTTFIL